MAAEKKKSKDKKDDKGKKGKKGAAGGISVAGHPRAAAAIRRSKGFGGLAGFALAGLLAHGAGLSLSHTLERALIAGIAGYVLAWACAVTVWRQIIAAQLRAVVARRAAAAPSRRKLTIGAPGEGADTPAPPEQAPATAAP